MQIVCKFYLCTVITKPTINIWLDSRRVKKNNKYPVKIRITHKRERYYYPTNISLTESEFENALSPKPSMKMKETHLKLNELERQATTTVDKIVDELHTEFSIDLFEKYLHINNSDYRDVFKCFQRKIDYLNSQGQIKTATGYQTAMKAFKNYTGRTALLFFEVDKMFMEGFESFMVKEKKSLTTVGIYARSLRTIFNDAIDEKLVNSELYPFGRNKYQVPQTANNKRALEEVDLLKIFKYKPEENSSEEFAKDMWTLSLLCQGMNMKDIANLRFESIQNNKIEFTREKTKRTKKAAQTPIIVYLSTEAKQIIKRQGNKNASPDQYIFPIYSDDNSPLQNLRRVEQVIKMVNKYMRKIAAKLKIKQDFTFYAARHSFATMLKRQGRSVSEIQEFLGHTNVRTTERYLASFGDEHKRIIMKNFVRQLKGN